MKQATQEQRETVRRAIHAIFAHLSAGALREMAERQQAVNYAGAQLGTSSQAKAHGEKMAAIDKAVDNLSDFYICEMADYIAPEPEAVALLKGRLAELSAEAGKVRAALHKTRGELAQCREQLDVMSRDHYRATSE